MSDDDMIRRGDALASIENALNNATGDLYDAYAAIADLPAVTVGVPEATVYRAVLDWIRDDAGAAVKMSMTPDRANALTARILAALDLTPAPDTNQKGGDALARSRSSTHAPHDTSPGVTAGAMPAPDADAEDAIAKGETCGQMLDRLGADGAKWAAEFRTTALRLGYSDMDEGWLIGWFCNAIMAGHDRQPAPDAAAIREAALREAAAEIQRWWEDNSDNREPTPLILALLRKGGA